MTLALAVVSYVQCALTRKCSAVFNWITNEPNRNSKRIAEIMNSNSKTPEIFQVHIRDNLLKLSSKCEGHFSS